MATAASSSCPAVQTLDVPEFFQYMEEEVNEISDAIQRLGATDRLTLSHVARTLHFSDKNKKEQEESILSSFGLREQLLEPVRAWLSKAIVEKTGVLFVTKLSLPVTVSFLAALYEALPKESASSSPSSSVDAATDESKNMHKNMVPITLVDGCLPGQECPSFEPELCSFPVLADDPMHRQATQALAFADLKNEYYSLRAASGLAYLKLTDQPSAIHTFCETLRQVLVLLRTRNKHFHMQTTITGSGMRPHVLVPSPTSYDIMVASDCPAQVLYEFAKSREFLVGNRCVPVLCCLKRIARTLCLLLAPLDEVQSDV